MEQERTAAPARPTKLKFLTIVGILTALLLYGWIFTHWDKTAAVSGTFNKIIAAVIGVQSTFIPSSQITLSTNESLLISGIPFTLSWNHTKKKNDGSYIFSYDCAENFYFLAETPIARDKEAARETVFCNTPFNFLNADNSLSLVPVLSKENTSGKNISFRIGFTPNGENSVQTIGTMERFVLPRAGENETVVIDEIKKDAAPLPSPDKEKTVSSLASPSSARGTTAVPTARGNGIDFAVIVKGLGVLNTKTNEFIPREKIYTTDIAAISFEIINQGGTISPPWTFQVSLPTYPADVFVSDTQQPLGYNDRIAYTLGFDQINPYINEWPITINIDPRAIIMETNKKNNAVKVLLPVTRP